MLATAVVLLLEYTIFRGLEFGAVTVPQPPEVTVARLDQGWSDNDPGWTIRDYHHMSQGTKILPYTWFMSLDEPTLDPIFPRKRLASPEYMSRFGFLYDPAIDSAAKGKLRSETQEAERDTLPIGFAVENEFSAEYAVPPTANHTKVVGLTCSGCHTGRIDVEVGGGKTYGYLVDGGSAMINLGAFQDAVGHSLAYTLFFRDRWNEFSARVLGNDSTDAVKKTALEAQVRAYVTTGIAGKNYAKEHKLNPVEGGFSRTDALGLIGNRVFGPLNTENQTVTDAPVNFPHLWDTAWFDWVQYNASIRMPMARNIGEALGVGAAVKPGKNVDDHIEYTVNIKNLDWIERFLGGDQPLPTYTADPEKAKGNDKRSDCRRASPPQVGRLRGAGAEGRGCRRLQQ